MATSCASSKTSPADTQQQSSRPFWPSSSASFHCTARQYCTPEQMLDLSWELKGVGALLHRRRRCPTRRCRSVEVVDRRGGAFLLGVRWLGGGRWFALRAGHGYRLGGAVAPERRAHAPRALGAGHP